jgi:membrane protease YdiL (CAAX protease family)
MSVILDPARYERSPSSGRTGLWFACFVAAALLGGALLGGALIRMVLAAGDGWARDLILENGPARVLRRIQTLCAVALAPWLLRRIGWRGLDDIGWSQGSTPAGERLRGFCNWFAVGCVLMSLLFLLSLWLGVRNWQPPGFWEGLRRIFTAFVVTGIGVGILEETLTRGVLYRVLARAWSPWTAAGVTSLLFAWAHFMKAPPESFSQGIGAVVRGSLFAEFANPVVPLKFLNMFLFGLVLCRLVRSTGEIWAAAGLHAAAVGAIKCFSRFTEFNPAQPYRAWIGGHSAKFDDGWLLSLLLLILLGLLEWRRGAAPSSRVRL